MVADTSTVAPETVRAARAGRGAVGADLLDTPVSGSVSTVEQGALTIMVGGDREALDRDQPMLAPLLPRIVHLGPMGSGAAMKLAVNSVVHALNRGCAEALILAERAGLDREAAYDVLAGSAVGAPFVQYKRAAFLTPDDAPVAFSLDLVAKDLDLAAALAAAVGAPVAQLPAIAMLCPRPRRGLWSGRPERVWVSCGLRPSRASNARVSKPPEIGQLPPPERLDEEGNLTVHLVQRQVARLSSTWIAEDLDAEAGTDSEAPLTACGQRR